ncbi:hypothetical protein HRG_002473 [Hirsutella rhossiliensis]|uniref:Myb-like domain-containing protein n=1 Tax=Hirsutella rhossiliensis TaxID=111463 RepID=A0A9P8N793_9HYPO|nr:uncharacterized protein HRG_02473 [Hirsutella rhossiliensis]KAH0967064.1 hypothetical protein HRG_02473 [Hirsutella rhossiliensis]
MPPKKTSGNEVDAPLGLTDGELRLMKAVFDNMTQKPDADWACVATALGLKDAKCAKERFRQMSVRHGWRDQASASTTTASPRKRGASTAPSQEAKVTKKRMPRKKAGKRGSADDEAIKAEDAKEDGETDEDEI